ncbi:GtrA family protein [Polymorphospora sp. NPDC050346]|uniref:GtrA family protein n=1 Tax=Polymorphospora sp. NPDC050346 TaxID=3155780 RepID=UPI0033E67F42
MDSVVRPDTPTGGATTPRRSALARLLDVGFVRFLAVGGASAALDTGLLWLLHGALGVWLPAATLTAVVAAFVLNFLLNRSWVFVSGGSAGGQFVRYLVLAGLNWVLTVAAVTGLVALGAHYLVARVGVLAVLTVLNFVAYRVWVFRPPAPA